MTMRDLKDFLVIAFLAFMLFGMWVEQRKASDLERQSFFARCLDDHPDDTTCADLWDIAGSK
jgi:hypothetical protein